MTLTKDDWRDVYRAIGDTLKLDDDGSHAALRESRELIANACKQSGSQEVKIERPVEWFAEIWFALNRRPARFDTAVVACLFDLHGGW